MRRERDENKTNPRRVGEKKEGKYERRGRKKWKKGRQKKGRNMKIK